MCAWIDSDGDGVICAHTGHADMAGLVEDTEYPFAR